MVQRLKGGSRTARGGNHSAAAAECGGKKTTETGGDKGMSSLSGWGVKWGLKLGERIVVPPHYRNICPPVGGYCAFEEKCIPMGTDGPGRQGSSGSQIPEGGDRG